MKRSWLKPKARPTKAKVSWRTGAVRESAIGMCRLRRKAWERSEGKCECGAITGTPCTRPASWHDGQLHHLWPRSDVLERVLFINRECHRKIHGEPMWALRCKQEAEQQ